MFRTVSLCPSSGV